jgi:hypothetical protein
MKRFHENENHKERERVAKRPRTPKSDRDILLGGIPPRRSICLTRKTSQSSISSDSETTISCDHTDREVDLMECPTISISDSETPISTDEYLHLEVDLMEYPPIISSSDSETPTSTDEYLHLEVEEATISNDEYLDLEVDLMEYPISKKRKYNSNTSSRD